MDPINVLKARALPSVREYNFATGQNKFVVASNSRFSIDPSIMNDSTKDGDLIRETIQMVSSEFAAKHIGSDLPLSIVASATHAPQPHSDILIKIGSIPNRPDLDNNDEAYQINIGQNIEIIGVGQRGIL
jgi:hypothetical protein